MGLLDYVIILFLTLSGYYIVFNFVRTLHSVLFSGSTMYIHSVLLSGCTMYIPANSLGGFLFLHTLSTIYYLYIFLMMAILTGVRLHFVVIPICISPRISYANHLFMCLLVFCMSF